MKPFLLAAICWLILTPLFGQHQIVGKVIDNKKHPVFFATVVLYAAVDSQVVEGLSSEDDGTFAFKNVKAGDYFISVSMLGYENRSIDKILMPADESKNYTIQLDDDVTLLSTVEIKEKLPLLEQRADKLIVNVEGNVTNTGGSLLDVMKKVPGMLVVNDRLSLAGSGTPTILINGRSTQYMDVQSLLKDMPGDNIQKVEIIHQPGAEYEASGSGPILNIIIKKNSLFGTNGNVSVGVGKGELWDYTTGLNVSHYAGNFNISGGLGYSRNSWIDGLEITRRLNNINPAIDGVYNQVNRDAATPDTYRANVRLDWDVTDKHHLGIDSKYITNSNERVALNTTNVNLLDDNFEDYTLITNNDIDRGWDYLSINPYYVYEFDTTGQKLEFDVNIAQYKVDGFNVLATTNSLNQSLDQQRYTQPGDTEIFASKLDYTKPLNRIFEVKVGGKYSFADLDNDLKSEYVDQGKWVNNADQSNHYLFEEKVYAGYGKLSWTTGDWSGTVGLRYEKSESRGQSITIDSMLSRDISKFFPSFSISRKINKSISSAISYSYRINRPSYSTLNPFVYYLDPFTYESGNPSILPELTHSAKFTLTYDGQPFFNVEYKKSNDAIVEVTQQEPDSEEAFKTDINFDQRSTLSGMLVAPLSFIPGIDGYIGVILTNTKYNSIYEGEVFERERLSTTAFVQIELKLPGEIQAEVGGWYQGRSQEGIFDAEYLYGSSAGLSKKFMGNRAKISIGIEDYISRFWHANVNYQQDMDIVSTWQRPVVNMRFSYKFGNQFLNSKKRRSGSASEEIQRATSD